MPNGLCCNSLYTIGPLFMFDMFGIAEGTIGIIFGVASFIASVFTFLALSSKWVTLLVYHSGHANITRWYSHDMHPAMPKMPVQAKFNTIISKTESTSKVRDTRIIENEKQRPGKTPGCWFYVLQMLLTFCYVLNYCIVFSTKWHFSPLHPAVPKMPFHENTNMQIIKQWINGNPMTAEALSIDQGFFLKGILSN